MQFTTVPDNTSSIGVLYRAASDCAEAAKGRRSADKNRSAAATLQILRRIRYFPVIFTSPPPIRDDGIIIVLLRRQVKKLSLKNALRECLERYILVVVDKPAPHL
jgi:hypothetical protein